MPDLLLTLLRLIFLGLVYLFVWQVARSISTHLGLGGGRRTRRSGTRVAVVRSESQSGATFTVTDSMVLGRSDEADFYLDDPYASDFHLRLSAREGRLVVNDLGSTNGTYVNGRRVTTPVDLNRGDAVQVGKTVMEVR
jgi:pSer/pThr/pTyr-binding forkhead associated (FHA) protein